jgi:hypothetical protein
MVIAQCEFAANIIGAAIQPALMGEEGQGCSANRYIFFSLRFACDLRMN